jgi:hypothetical protein
MRGWRRRGYALAAAGIVLLGLAAGPAAAATGKSTDNQVNGLSCVTPRFCVAVGSVDSGFGSNMADTWNGRVWRLVSTPDPLPAAAGSELGSVSCWSAAGCLTLGDGPPNYGDQWDGHRWRLLKVPNARRGEVDLNGISCPAARDCLVVGSYTLTRGGEITAMRTSALRWQGGRWTVLRPRVPKDGQLPELTDVSCASPTDCLAIGDFDPANPFYDGNESLAEAWNGRSWRLLKIPQPPGRLSGPADLQGVACAPSGRCLTVGTYQSDYYYPQDNEQLAFAASWDGGALHLAAVPQPGVSSVLNAVSCATASRCMVLGSYQPTATAGQLSYTQLWTGRGWATYRLPRPAVSYSVLSCPTGSSCLTVGPDELPSGNAPQYGAVWNGRRWRAVGFPNP